LVNPGFPWLRVRALAVAIGSILVVGPSVVSAVSGGAPRDPYRSAIVIEADSNNVLSEEEADRAVYPASIVQLMSLRVVRVKSRAGE
jgi:D-alanyl-D-alanine carboxypeptidase